MLPQENFDLCAVGGQVGGGSLYSEWAHTIQTLVDYWMAAILLYLTHTNMLRV